MFVRGAPTQRPADTLIQQMIDDVAAALDAGLMSRYGEIILQTYGGNFAAFQAAFTPDATNALERINRYGAAASLGHTLASFGAASAERLAETFDTQFSSMMAAFTATNKTGAPSLYDHLFDPASGTVSPRPGFDGVAGGDQPKGQTSADEGVSNFFGKFDVR